MKEICNPFAVGDKIVCISDKFPIIPEYSKGETIETLNKPRIGEVLTVDEVLGDFVRFNSYDSDSFNWWFWNRFKKLDDVSCESLYKTNIAATIAATDKPKTAQHIDSQRVTR